ncbi:MAG: hypothetical protein D3904_02055 [Candidatus Electrothrix sp. EH2]|nr:hypothetical protein [Candidatus Electrothrix sp. EH2]
MIDEIIQELWKAKDDIAKEHNCSIDKLSEFYIKRQQAGVQHKIYPRKEGENFSYPSRRVRK